MKKLLLLAMLTALISGNLLANENLVTLDLWVVEKEVHQKGEAFAHIQFSDSSFSENHMKLIEITVDKSLCMVSKEVEGVMRCPENTPALVKISNSRHEVEFEQRVENVIVRAEISTRSSIMSFGNGSNFETEISKRQELLINIRLDDENRLNARGSKRISLEVL